MLCLICCNVKFSIIFTRKSEGLMEISIKELICCKMRILIFVSYRFGHKSWIFEFEFEFFGCIPTFFGIISPN